MKNLIACCGINCETCDARIATVNNDEVLRTEIAKKWRLKYHVKEITPEMINCTGCRVEGAKIGHCTECEIRICVQKKEYRTCSDCSKMDTCTIIGSIHQQVPMAKENLLGLK